MIPDDGLQPKDGLCDGNDTVIRVPVWRPPVLWYTTTSRVVDNVHGPAQLAQDVFIAQSRHVRMRPSVNSDIVFVGIERGRELFWVVQDIHADEEMGRVHVVFLQERVQGIGGLDNAFKI